MPWLPKTPFSNKLYKTAETWINCMSAHPRGCFTKPHRARAQQNFLGSKIKKFKKKVSMRKGGGGGSPSWPNLGNQASR